MSRNHKGTTGKKQSEETKRKIAEAVSGKWSQEKADRATETRYFTMIRRKQLKTKMEEIRMRDNIPSRYESTIRGLAEVELGWAISTDEETC